MEEKRNQKKKMKRMLKERGITLVALVVTIIILLILAGVTLNIALSENGLFKRARNATERYQLAEKNENNQLKELEKQLDKYGQGGIGSSKVAENLKQYQGKYVDIGLDANENTDTTDDWKIFYAGNGRIFLIAADYVPVTTLTTWGVLKNLSSNGFTSSGSYVANWSTPTGFLTLPSTPDNFLSLVKHEGYSLTTKSGNPNSIAVSHLLNTDKWKGITDAANEARPDCVDFAIGGPTLEMWCAAWNEAVGADNATFKQIQPDGSGSDGYHVGCKATNEEKRTFLYMNGTTSLPESNLTTLGDDYKTFFPHVGSSAWNGCYGYWMASPSTRSSQCLVLVYCGGDVGADSYDCSYGVRPLVSLKSGVQLVEKKGTEDKYDVTN